MLCSLLVLLVLVVLVRSGLPVLPVPVLVLFVLVLFVLVLFVLFVLAVLAVLVLVDWPLLAENVCALIGSGPTRASSSSVASIETRGAPCWRRWVTKCVQHEMLAKMKEGRTRDRVDTSSPVPNTGRALRSAPSPPEAPRAPRQGKEAERHTPLQSLLGSQMRDQITYLSKKRVINRSTN